MSMRSQIYVRVPVNGKRKLIARDFSWNFAERMVSRARYLIEWLSECLGDQPDLVFMDNDRLEKLRRVIDTNFDMVDVMLSGDLILEWQQNQDFGAFSEYVFRNCACSDGKLFVDVLSDGTIKYAFLNSDCDTDNVMDALDYMDWETDERSDDANEKELVVENANAIYSAANLMTSEELEQFISYPYGFEQTDGAQYGIQITENAPYFEPSKAVCRIVWYDTQAERDRVLTETEHFGLRCARWVSHLPYRLSKVTYDTDEIPGYRYKE